MTLHIGVFFDGTGNNMYQHEPIQKGSNVARLFRAYPDQPQQGLYSIYVPGVGTPFPEIGESKPMSLGAAFGAGGDGRINFGLLQVFNSVHRAVSPSDRPYALPGTVKALCRNGQRLRKTGHGQQDEFTPLEGPEDEAALRAVGMDQRGGLLLDSYAQSVNRPLFFRQASKVIAEKIGSIKKPKPIEIFIDVFGFSRGAVQARTFCTWLLEIMDSGTLCGVKSTIRFLGLFDSVASVGVPTSSGRLFDGHASWGDAPFLRISPAIKNCVHYVAMHENRGSFPSELVRSEGVLPNNCHEYMFPGMHSDVGGGYAPAEQGRGPNKRDDEKLAQLPLLMMYEAARRALVPLNKTSAVGRHGDPFAVAENVRHAFTAFMGARQKSQMVREWLFEYLAWRYEVRHSYPSLPWRARASAKDIDDLNGANQRLIEDVAALAGLERTVRLPRAGLWSPQAAEREALQSRVSSLEPEAPQIFSRLKKASPTDTAAAALFSDYVHDSYAGFRPFDQLKIWGWDPIPGSWEAEGYLRWRRRYEGTDHRYVRLEESSPAEQTA